MWTDACCVPEVTDSARSNEQRRRGFSIYYHEMYHIYLFKIKQEWTAIQDHPRSLFFWFPAFPVICFPLSRFFN